MEIINGNIVDKNFSTGLWFIIYDNGDGVQTIEGIATKQQAIAWLREVEKR